MAGQELSSYFQINTICSQSTLLLSTSSLQFNDVFVDQKRTLPLTITNTSYLPQKISFVKLKKEIDVQPNDGFTILLPNENFTFFVNFTPSSPINYSFDLILLTNINDKITIKITANGIICPLLFNYSNLFLRTACPGESVIENIMVQNITDRKICFEFIIPDFRYSWLKISPTIIELNPSKSCRVEIEFIPPSNLINENPKEWFSQLKNILSDEKKINDKIKNKAENENEKSKLNNDENKIMNIENKSNGADFRKNDDLNTTFDGFSDFEDFDGFISVKNSFGEIQWARSTEFKLEDINEKENKNENENDRGMNDKEITISPQTNGNNSRNNYDNAEMNKNENDAENVNSQNQFLLSSIMERSDLLSENNSRADFEVSPNAINNNESYESKKLKKEQNIKRKKEIELEKIMISEKEIEEERRIERENEIIELKSDLSQSEWGVSGTWSIPIYIRTKNNKNNHTNKNENNENIIDNEKNNSINNSKVINNRTITTKKEKDSTRNEVWNLSSSSDQLPPLFFGIQTVTTLPQIESDIKIIDFGNMALGSRIIKTIIISNLHYNSVQLITDNTNAVGPFAIINPLKTIDTQEFKKISIECIPTSSGLFTEKLEFRTLTEVGGHRIQIFLRAQGVTPSISLEGLLPPPKPWGIKSGSGILDFGNILIGDVAINNFTVFNHSSFPITVLLTRAVTVNLSPYNALNEITNRTINGIPIFNFRPEEMKLQPGEISLF